MLANDLSIFSGKPLCKLKSDFGGSLCLLSVPQGTAH